MTNPVPRGSTPKPGKIRLVLETLGAEIAQGGFPEGGRLPSEPGLEERFQASRSVIREAMKTLAAKGLVTVGPRLGTRVRPREDWNVLDRDVLQWMTGAKRIDRDLSRAIGEVRLIIEPAAAALAADRASAADIESMRAAFAAMTEAAANADVPAAIRADKDFHLAVLVATHNPVLRAFDTAIDSILGVLFDTAVNHMENFRTNLADHGAVAEAIARGDAAAASAAMRRLVEFTREKLQENDLY